MNDQSSLEAKLAALQARLDVLEHGQLSAPRRRARWALPGLLVAVTVTGVALAQPTGLIVFAANKPAVAADVNANFTYLNNRIDALATPGAGQKAVPVGTIAFFATACPTGWAVYGSAAGRFIVGNPSGGLSGRTVGPGPLADNTEPTHLHEWAWMSAAPAINWHTYSNAGVDNIMMNWGDGQDTAGSGNYPVGRDTSGEYHAYTSLNTANLPYIQLNACVKL